MTEEQIGELLREASTLRIANEDLRRWVDRTTRLLAEVREHLAPSSLRDHVEAVVGTLPQVASGNGRLEGALRYFTMHEVALGCFLDREIAVAYARAQGGSGIEIIGTDHVVHSVEFCECCSDPLFDEDDYTTDAEGDVNLCWPCANALTDEAQEGD